MTVQGQRTWQELHGFSSIDLEQETPKKQGICTARSFGKNLTQLEEISEAVASYVADSAKKLRKEQQLAGKMSVFIMTNRFLTREPQYNNSLQIKLPVATDNTIVLTQYALFLLKKIYRKGYKYTKAGVFRD